jgi:hypothetical protein
MFATSNSSNTLSIVQNIDHHRLFVFSLVSSLDNKLLSLAAQ